MRVIEDYIQIYKIMRSFFGYLFFLFFLLFISNKIALGSENTVPVILFGICLLIPAL